MEHQIRFCTTSDGVRIAYATMGKGPPPVVSVPGWFSPFKVMAHEPRVASAWQRAAGSRQVILYDRRGTGMSDRAVHDFSRGALVKDLEAVIDELKLRRVGLYAANMAGLVAIEYAFRHSKKVSYLILVGSYARGRDLGPQDTAQALARLMRSSWGIAAEMWPALVMPGADPDSARRYFTALRESCSGDSAADQLEATLAEDVTELLPQIKTPTLVLHPREGRNFPFELGRELASLLPNARLVPLPWDATYDPGNLDPLIRAIEEFLAEGIETPAPLPSGTAVILFADIADSTGLTERLGDAQFREKARELDSALRGVIRENGGTPVEGKLLGDGVLAVFTSARQAIEAALACGCAGDEAGLPLHLGLHAGDVIREENNVYGGAVNIAGRISALSAPGELLVSDTLRGLARTSAGVSFEDRGERELKGVSEPVRLWAVVKGGPS